ncbi:MAG: TetR/AcrR family transcriptional regulator [Bacteroidota bacterium]
MPRTREFDEQAVLARARDLFWERGYSATSIKDLETHLGISRSSLYQTFGDNRALYDRTLMMYQEESLGALRKALSAGSDLRTTLTEMMTQAALTEHKDCATGSRGCYVVNATTEMANSCSEALGFVAKNRESFVAIMAEALARAQVQGEVQKQSEPTELANYLFICYTGLQVVVQTGIERQQLVRAVEQAISGLPWT